MKLSIEQARAMWARAQGLLGRAEAPLSDVVADTGWIRTLGGAEAYLALRARARGVTVGAVHAATAEGKLQVVPGVRGCIYLVPSDEVGLSLRTADLLSARRTARELEKAGISVAELDEVGEAVLASLAGEPKGTRALRKALPDGVVRRLGDAGKKVGISSTLPPALRRLELAGRIVRRQRDDRLDHERYVWTVARQNPLESVAALDEAAIRGEIAKRFVAWAGPATRDELAAWSGFGKRDSAAALEGAGLLEVDVDGTGTAYVSEQALASSSDEAGDRLVWLPALDNFFGLRASASPLVDPAHAGVEVSWFGRPGSGPLGETCLPLDRTLVRHGRVVGLWAWDPDEDDVVAVWLEGEGPGDAEAFEAERTEIRELLGELGHGKAFSLDKPETLRKRLTRIRAAG